MLFKKKNRLLENLFIEEDCKSMTELDNSHIVSLTILLNFRYAKNSSHLRAVATLNAGFSILNLQMVVSACNVLYLNQKAPNFKIRHSLLLNVLL